MFALRIKEVADLLGVSDDTARRWVDTGRLTATRDDTGRLAVEGREVADFARSMAEPVDRGGLGRESARNLFRGIVTRVVRDGVMAQVDLQAGPHRIVSLMSREAADDLGLEPGVVAYASVKATQVVIEVSDR
ncbi:MAG: TOBE domain-containing protein [Candidatus Nanopelagicales bacterium]